jgi:hypothetical protein
MLRLGLFASFVVVLTGCSNCGEGGGAQPIETVDAASVAEGKLGHQMTAIPQERPQGTELRPVTNLAARADAGAH